MSIEGLGRLHKTPIFPCGIFQCKKGVNRSEGDKNYDLFKLALKSTAKRLYPNYANVDWSVGQSWLKKDRDDKEAYIETLSKKDKEKLIEEISNNNELSNFLDLKVENDSLVVTREEKPIEMFSTMGCRTVNGHDVNFIDSYKENIQSVIRGEGLKYDDCESGAQKDGRGNIAPVTIILPTIAMKALEAANDNCENGATPSVDDVVEEFFRILEEKMVEAKDMLIERFNWICRQPAQSAKFMYENKTMEGYDGENISSALKHGTLMIGQIGIAETLQILVGCDQTEERGMELAKRIEELWNKRCADFKKEYNLNFGVYYTPAENLCNTALKNFRKKYGIIENVSDKEFFTNSMHVPVWHEMDPFKKIDIESQLTSYSNAGCITYVELPSSCEHNTEALEVLVNYAMDGDIPYFAVNVPNDQCQDCGWTGEIGQECPVCGGENIQRLRRVTGYLTGNYTTAFNAGKIDEVEHRVKHIKD